MSVSRLTEFAPLFAFFADFFLSFLSPFPRDRRSAAWKPAFVPSELERLTEAFISSLNGASGAERRSYEEEYHALFSGLRFPSLELWESCYISESGKDKRLLNRVTRGVAALYREAGLGVDADTDADKTVRQPPDHIGVECAFFSWLCGGGPRYAELCRSFFTGHLRPFAELFGIELESRTREAPYKILARLLRKSAALAENAIQDSIESGASFAPLEKREERTQNLPAGLRFLTADEMR
ncbi:MAG: molecular chaperone TorD family protein, partial [Oscillospiraceae bacterium]|nr:molecular chaperone TorD family protein [Oscillospiraceae bacterium]